jgi:hypothetical protein
MDSSLPRRFLALDTAFGSLRTRAGLLALVPILVTAVLLWQGLPSVYEAYEKPASGDIRYIIDAGNVVTDDCPPCLYRKDQPSVQRGLDLSIAHGYAYPYHYPYAPAFAYLMVPIADLDHDLAGRLWQALTAAATLVLAVLVAATFRGWSWRILMAAAVVCWEPLLLNARIGQTGALVAAGTAVALLAFFRNRNLGAVLLGLLVLKPTAVIAPFFLIFPERLGVWARFYATVAALALLPFLWLGADGLFGWIESLTDRALIDLTGGHAYNQGLSAVLSLKNTLGLVLIAVALVLLALLVNAAESRLGIRLTAALTICLALIFNPHSLVYDWGVAFVVIMLIRSGGLFAERFADALATALALALFVGGQLVWRQFLEGQVVHLLTVWGLAVIAVLVLVGVSPRLRGLVAMAPRQTRPGVAQDGPAPEPEATPSS